ncbi:Uncharacterized membrane protein, DUF373 family [Desulfonatronum zhilinae]|nr:Uncharacterized membrane protein, DUF373 family [Desulfonatronum zhilinae]
MKFDCDDKLLCSLQYVIHFAVRVLAVLMVFVIVMGVIDVAWMLYQKLNTAPRFILTISDMLATFGAFMAVLIAIEIFVNITIYLREDIIHVKIVMATALMAIARKVIIMDIDKVEPQYIYAIGAVVLAMSVGYWLVHKLSAKEHHEEDDCIATIVPRDREPKNQK